MGCYAQQLDADIHLVYLVCRHHLLHDDPWGTPLARLQGDYTKFMISRSKMGGWLAGWDPKNGKLPRYEI